VESYVHSSQVGSELQTRLRHCLDCVVFTAWVICISSPSVVIIGSVSWDTAKRRDLLLRILEQVRRRYSFVVVGYVAMPEHMHLLLASRSGGIR
jgi:hypothetical protein